MGLKQRQGQAVPTASRGGSGLSAAYQPIPEGNYAIKVEAAEEGHYEAGYKDLPYKFRYLKLRPQFVIKNEFNTTINKQDITFGAVDEAGFLFRPDGDMSKTALFSGAQFFLSAIGFVQDVEDVDGKPVLDENGEPVQEVALDLYNASLIGGQWFIGKVKTKTFQTGGETRQKNEIVGFFRMKPEEVEKYGLYLADSGMVFDNEQAAQDWQELFDNLPEDGDDSGIDPFDR